jgi:hypothetical protein
VAGIRFYFGANGYRGKLLVRYTKQTDRFTAFAMPADKLMTLRCVPYGMLSKGKRKKRDLIAVCNKLLKQAFAIAKSGLIYEDT